MEINWAAFESMSRLSVARGVSLRRFSSLGIGGLAAGAVTADDEPALKAAVDSARSLRIPVKIVGGGTNVIFTDDGFPGLLIRLGESFKKIEIEGARVSTGSAVHLPALITRTMEIGLSGLEKLAGIPGTIGGAIFQNSGARDYETARAIAAVTFFDPVAGRVETFPSDRLEFGYRTSLFRKTRAVILSAELKLSPAPREEIMAEVSARMKHRNATQPTGRSVGCIFKNPSPGGKSAGQLIDEAGLKGTRSGGISVSDLHGNFFLNDGSAAFHDFENLVSTVQSAVSDKYGINLELEVEIVRDIKDEAQSGQGQDGENSPVAESAKNRPLRRWKVSGEGNFI